MNFDCFPLLHNIRPSRGCRVPLLFVDSDASLEPMPFEMLVSRTIDEKHSINECANASAAGATALHSVPRAARQPGAAEAAGGGGAGVCGGASGPAAGPALWRARHRGDAAGHDPSPQRRRCLWPATAPIRCRSISDRCRSWTATAAAGRPG